MFKANELNVNHINDIFHINNKFTFTQFLNTYKDEPLKIFAIDSAEKIAEISNINVLDTLIQQLKENDWSIIFTTRYAYLNDLIFHLKENYQLTSSPGPGAASTPPTPRPQADTRSARPGRTRGGRSPWGRPRTRPSSNAPTRWAAPAEGACSRRRSPAE